MADSLRCSSLALLRIRCAKGAALFFRLGSSQPPVHQHGEAREQTWPYPRHELSTSYSSLPLPPAMRWGLKVFSCHLAYKGEKHHDPLRGMTKRHPREY